MTDILTDFKFSKVQNILKVYEEGYVPEGRYQVQVKLDGANSGIIRTEEGLIVHSRNNVLGKMTVDNKGTFGGLSGFVEFVRERFNHFYDNLQVGDHVYAEWLVPHTIQYTTSMYNKLYIFDDQYLHLVDDTLGILSTLRLGDILITSTLHESGVDLVKRIEELLQPYANSVAHKSEGVVLTQYDKGNSYNVNTSRFKFVLPEFKEGNKTKFNPSNSADIELSMASDYTIRSFNKIVEKVKTMKSINTLSHSEIAPVLGLAWHDYCEEFLGDSIKKHKFPVVNTKQLKYLFDTRIREMVISLVNTGILPAWAMDK